MLPCIWAFRRPSSGRPQPSPFLRVRLWVKLYSCPVSILQGHQSQEWPAEVSGSEYTAGLPPQAYHSLARGAGCCQQLLKPGFLGDCILGSCSRFRVQAAGTLNLWLGSKMLAAFLRKYDWLMGGAMGGESRQKQGQGFLRNSSPAGHVR